MNTVSTQANIKEVKKWTTICRMCVVVSYISVVGIWLFVFKIFNPNFLKIFPEKTVTLLMSVFAISMVLFEMSEANKEKAIKEQRQEPKPEISEIIRKKFRTASENMTDELDFFTDFINDGFTLEDIKKYTPEHYEYSKKFMEEHGLK